jgi:hypothetical protein
MNFKHYFVCLTIVCLPACSLIETTREGSEVTLVKSSNVMGCTKLGTTHATVTHKVGIITRDDKVVTEELIIVAKNRAAEMGGDSIVAKAPAVEGKMSFEIYKCGK